LKTLIIGSGRMARHLEFYFRYLSIPLQFWSRTPSPNCQDSSVNHLEYLLSQSACVWLAISDSAIETTIDLISKLTFTGPIFHLSGAHVSSRAIDLHFLGSFSYSVFEPSFYEKIPLVTSHPGTHSILQQYYPQMKNPIQFISPENKARYHSTCVLGGPGSMTLWWLMQSEFQKMDLKADMILPYLETLIANWRQNQERALTGPWTRNDEITIKNNEEAFILNPITRNLYQALLEQYRSLKREISQ
jgi:hypothetical protein